MKNFKSIATATLSLLVLGFHTSAKADYRCEGKNFNLELYGWGADSDHFGEDISFVRRGKIVLNKKNETYTFNNILIRTDGAGNARFYSIQPEPKGYGLEFAANIFFDHEGGRISGSLLIPVFGDEGEEEANDTDDTEQREQEGWQELHITPKNCRPIH